MDDNIHLALSHNMYLQLKAIFTAKFDLESDLPVVFIDTHYNRSIEQESEAFDRETAKLWRISLNRRPFECLTRKDVQVTPVE